MKRNAFTLVEVLVVIAIIAVLVGIIMPATQAVRESARRARVSSELNQMSVAISTAKSTMSARYVPSHAYVKPSFDLTPHNPPITFNPNYDMNAEAVNNLRQFFGSRFGTPSPSNPYILQTGLPDWGEIHGSQCLVFFLGGYRDGGFTKGFSDNSNNPFVTSGGRHIPAFYDFAPNRLWAHPNGGPPVFADLWTRPDRMLPYFYFSSRKGGDYADSARIWNANGVNVLSAGTYVNVGTGERVTYATALSSMPIVDSMGKFAYADGWQIVSAGKNAQIGPGGIWKPGQGAYAPGQPGVDDYANFKGGPLGVAD